MDFYDLDFATRRLCTSAIDSKGEIMVTVKDNIMRFKVDFCPKCGKKFKKEI